MTKRFIQLAEVSEVLEISSAQAYALVRSGELPAINMVIYGVVLVLIVIFVPRGIAGIGLSARQLWAGKGGRRG